MRLVTRKFESLEKTFVFDGDKMIGSIDGVIAAHLGGRSEWSDIPSLGIRRVYLNSDTLFGGSLDSNQYQGAAHMVPRPGVRFKSGLVKSYNQQTRCTPLFDPIVSKRDLGLIQPVADAWESFITQPGTVNVSETARLCLMEARSVGWKISNTFVKFRPPTNIVGQDDRIRGVVLGRCDTWLDALIIVTLSSAGYFVVVQQVDGFAPALPLAHEFGFFSVYKASDHRWLFHSTVDTYDTYKPSRLSDTVLDKGGIVRSRDCDGGDHDGLFTSYAFMSHDKLLGCNCAFAFIPRSTDLTSYDYSDAWVTDDDVLQLLANPLSVVMDIGKNTLFDYPVHEGMVVKPKFVDMFSQGLAWDDIVRNAGDDDFEEVVIEQISSYHS